MWSADARRSVLVTEDEALISLDLCEALQDAGFDIIGPANTLQGAQFLFGRQRPHVAVVDLLLKGESSFPLMHQLHRHNVPFVIHTMYPKQDDLVALWHGAPWVSKLTAPADLVRQIDGLLAGTLR